MAFDVHSLEAYSTVLTAPSPATSGTSLVVQSGDGAKFGHPQNAVVWPAGTSIPTSANSEIVRITAISTDTFTITRTQEGSSARSIVVGDQIANVVTPKVLTDIEGLIVAGAPVWQYLGYAQITGTINTASTSFVAATGMTKTVTVPSGATAAKITIGASAINVSGQGNIWSLALYKDGTPVQQWYRNQDVSGYNIPLNVTYIDQSPTAGSHTYALYYGTSAGTVTITAGTTSTSLSVAGPASILVECC